MQNQIGYKIFLNIIFILSSMSIFGQDSQLSIIKYRDVFEEIPTNKWTSEYLKNIKAANVHKHYHLSKTYYKTDSKNINDFKDSIIHDSNFDTDYIDTFDKSGNWIMTKSIFNSETKAKRSIHNFDYLYYLDTDSNIIAIDSIKYNDNGLPIWSSQVYTNKGQLFHYEYTANGTLLDKVWIDSVKNKIDINKYEYDTIANKLIIRVVNPSIDKELLKCTYFLDGRLLKKVQDNYYYEVFYNDKNLKTYSMYYKLVDNIKEDMTIATFHYNQNNQLIEEFTFDINSPTDYSHTIYSYYDNNLENEVISCDIKSGEIYEVYCFKNQYEYY